MGVKLSNFRDVKRTGNTAFNRIIHAKVDVTTGFIFKKTKTVEVFSDSDGLLWRYLEGGNFTEGNAVNHMWMAYVAKEALGK